MVAVVPQAMVPQAVVPQAVVPRAVVPPAVLVHLLACLAKYPCQAVNQGVANLVVGRQAAVIHKRGQQKTSQVAMTHKQLTVAHLALETSPYRAAVSPCPQMLPAKVNSIVAGLAPSPFPGEAQLPFLVQ